MEKFLIWRRYNGRWLRTPTEYPGTPNGVLSMATRLIKLGLADAIVIQDQDSQRLVASLGDASDFSLPEECRNPAARIDEKPKVTA